MALAAAALTFRAFASHASALISASVMAMAADALHILASAGILIGTGCYNATRHLDTLRAIIASPYGLTLLAKMLLLLPVLVAGSLNFLVIRPALGSARPLERRSDEDRTALARRLVSLVEIEMSDGAAIVALAAVLSVVPPAVDDPRGTLSLTRREDMDR